MKLDNRGWGMKEMLVMCAALLIAGFISCAIYRKTFGKAGIMNYSMTHPTQQKGVSDSQSEENESENNSDSELESQNESSSNEATNTGYSNIELNINNIATEYLEKEMKNPEQYEMLYIGFPVLKKTNYLNDTDTAGCSGYIQVTKGLPKTFIRCENYQTEGYDSAYES